MTLRLILTDTPDPRDKQAAGLALYGHNVEQTGVQDRRPIAVIASDPATGEVDGGLWGRTELGVLLLDMFFLPAAGRGEGTGGKLLALVESEARAAAVGMPSSRRARSRPRASMSGMAMTSSAACRSTWTAMRGCSCASR